MSERKNDGAEMYLHNWTVQCWVRGHRQNVEPDVSYCEDCYYFSKHPSAIDGRAQYRLYWLITVSLMIFLVVGWWLVVK